MATLERAIEIATIAHKNQKDKTEAPYILHLIRVMQKGKSEVEKISGILHDLVEDTKWTFEEIEKEGFSKEVVDVLRLVTKESEDEDYNHFINRIITNKTAISVKLNDLGDNLDITRLNLLTNKDMVRLNKYLSAYNKLLQNL